MAGRRSPPPLPLPRGSTALQDLHPSLHPLCRPHVGGGRRLQAASAPSPSAAPAQLLSTAPELCGELAPFAAAAAGPPSLLLAADPGELSGTPEIKYLLGNANVSSTLATTSCPFVALGTLLGQPVALAVTGIGPPAAKACTAQLLSCGMRYREAVWLGTSGFSPQVRRQRPHWLLAGLGPENTCLACLRHQPVFTHAHVLCSSTARATHPPAHCASCCSWAACWMPAGAAAPPTPAPQSSARATCVSPPWPPAGATSACRCCQATPAGRAG